MYVLVLYLEFYPLPFSYIQFKVCVNQVIYDQWVGSELSYVSVVLQVDERHN